MSQTNQKSITNEKKIFGQIDVREKCLNCHKFEMYIEKSNYNKEKKQVEVWYKCKKCGYVFGMNFSGPKLINRYLESKESGKFEKEILDIQKEFFSTKEVRAE